jgi:hypothetical protein
MEQNACAITKSCFHQIRNIGRIRSYITENAFKALVDVDFRMIIITYNRPWSLQRLLLSLNTVDYMSDKVTVEIWIDRSKEGRIHEQTYAVGHKFVFEKGSISFLR